MPDACSAPVKFTGREVDPPMVMRPAEALTNDSGESINVDALS